jgi:hypothetical protein
LSCVTQVGMDVGSLISLIRDSEIVNENNWGTRDVMSSFTMDMVVRNPYFQNANFQPGQEENTTQYILDRLN